MLLRNIKGRIFTLFKSVMLISHKLTQHKRVATDFRHLNIRIAKNNLAYPLVRDTFLVLGNSKCEVLFGIRFKRHISFIATFRRSKEVLQYSTLFWECFIYLSKDAYGIKYIPLYLAIIYKCNLDCLETRKHCEAIMDNLLLFTPTKKAHIAKLEDLLKALLKNRLKISPKKCQLFKIKVQYMGNTVFIKERRVCVKLLRSRIEAILKLEPPKMPNGCRSFVGMVNF